MKSVRRRSVQAFSASLLFALTSLHAGAQQQQVSSALNAYIDGLHREAAFNGNILIVDGGKLVLQRAVGNADSSGKLGLDLDDRFEIGSIAKEFDSVGLLMLKEQGKLALTDPRVQVLS